MNVQHPLSGIVRSMNLHEMGLEVIGDGLVVVRSLAVRRDAVKALYPCQLVPGNVKRMGALFGNSGALGQFLLQQIGFIYNPCRFDGIKRSRGYNSLRKSTRWTFFNSLFAHICEKSWMESSILFVKGSSSRY